MAPAVEDGDEAEEEIEIQEDSQEVELMASAPSQVKPCRADVELHRFTHLPVRGWCPECFMGCGLGEVRGRHAGRQHGVLIVGVACFYMTSSGFMGRKETGFAEAEEGEKQVNEARGKGEILKCLVCAAMRPKLSTSMSCLVKRQMRTISLLNSSSLMWLGWGTSSLSSRVNRMRRLLRWPRALYSCPDAKLRGPRAAAPSRAKPMIVRLVAARRWEFAISAGSSGR